jgi:hypothetical protein
VFLASQATVGKSCLKKTIMTAITKRNVYHIAKKIKGRGTLISQLTCSVNGFFTEFFLALFCFVSDGTGFKHRSSFLQGGHYTTQAMPPAQVFYFH